jgi:hypothetical protein
MQIFAVSSAQKMTLQAPKRKGQERNGMCERKDKLLDGLANET